MNYLITEEECQTAIKVINRVFFTIDEYLSNTLVGLEEDRYLTDIMKSALTLRSELNSIIFPKRGDTILDVPF
jgi:hypothetical protein